MELKHESTSYEDKNVADLLTLDLLATDGYTMKNYVCPVCRKKIGVVIPKEHMWNLKAIMKNIEKNHSCELVKKEGKCITKFFTIK